MSCEERVSGGEGLMEDGRSEGLEDETLSKLRSDKELRSVMAWLEVKGVWRKD